MGRFNEIMEVARRGDFGRGDRRFSKDDFFSGDPAPIQAEMVLEHITPIIEMLAEQGEFITEREWHEPRHGHARDKSLKELAGYRGEYLEFENGFVCTDDTRDKVPKEQPTYDYQRNAYLESASKEDNVEFWTACDNGNFERALTLWQTKNIDLEFQHNEDQSSDEKYTPLMAAASEGSNLVVQFLLEVGANPDAISPEEKTTALMLATNNGHDSVALSLLDAILSHYHGDCKKQHEALTRQDTDDENALEFANYNCRDETEEKLSQAINDAERGIDNSKPKIKKSFMKPLEVAEPDKKCQKESDTALAKHGGN